VTTTLRWRWQFARSLRYTRPWFLVGRGMWLHSRGKSKRGGASIARGLAIAERYGLLGEQQELHTVLARFSEATRRRRDLRRATTGSAHRD
jgi:hypothetical protein